MPEATFVLKEPKSKESIVVVMRIVNGGKFFTSFPNIDHR
jgi:hypothetical protein